MIHNDMNNVLSIVNFVKTRALISRLLSIDAKICDPFKTQIFHMNTDWFLRSKVVTEVMELSDKLHIFFLIFNQIYLYFFVIIKHERL